MKRFIQALMILIILLTCFSCDKEEEKIFLNGYYSGTFTLGNATYSELISFTDEFYIEFPSLGIKNQLLPCFSHGYYELDGNTITFDRAEKTNCSGPDRLLSGEYDIIQMGDTLIFEKGLGDEYVVYTMIETSVQ